MTNETEKIETAKRIIIKWVSHLNDKDNILNDFYISGDYLNFTLSKTNKKKLCMITIMVLNRHDVNICNPTYSRRKGLTVDCFIQLKKVL